MLLPYERNLPSEEAEEAVKYGKKGKQWPLAHRNKYTSAVVHKKCTNRSATSQAATLALFTRPACRAAAVAGRAARTLKGFLSLVSGGRVLASHWPRLERVTGCQPIRAPHKKLGQRGADADCWSRRGKCPPLFPGEIDMKQFYFRLLPARNQYFENIKN